MNAPEPTFLGKAEIWRTAEAFADSVGFLPGDSLGPLVERLGGTVSYLGVHDSFFEHDGSLRVEGPNNFEIRISSLTGAERDRFTIAHELGHYVLHSRRGQRQILARRCGSDRAEWEANWFAAALLMPTADFKQACALYGNSVPLVAARYLVSQKAAQVRMETLGIVPRI